MWGRIKQVVRISQSWCFLTMAHGQPSIPYSSPPPCPSPFPLKFPFTPTSPPQRRQDDAADCRERWNAAAAARMAHLAMPLNELLTRREEMRAAFKTLPEMNEEEWRFVVVVGPAGKGKSSFIREQLQSHGYAGGGLLFVASQFDQPGRSWLDTQQVANTHPIASFGPSGLCC